MNRKFVYFGLAATLCASAAFAEQLFVNSQSVDILSDKSALSDVLTTVPKGTALNVVAHEDKWVKVQTGPQEGYVFEDALSVDKPNGEFAAGVGLNTGVTEGAAGKGLQPDATEYAKGKNLSPKAIEDLISFNKTIKGSDLKAFAAAGKVGKFRQ